MTLKPSCFTAPYFYRVLNFIPSCLMTVIIRQPLRDNTDLIHKAPGEGVRSPHPAFLIFFFSFRLQLVYKLISRKVNAEISTRRKRKNSNKTKQKRNSSLRDAQLLATQNALRNIARNTAVRQSHVYARDIQPMLPGNIYASYSTSG